MAAFCVSMASGPGEGDLNFVMRAFAVLTLTLGLGLAAPAFAQGQGAGLGGAVPPSELHTGFFRGHIATYRQVGDLKILEGDILLDHVDDLASMATAGRQPNGIG